MTLLLNPLSQTEFILDGTEKAGLVFGVLTALYKLASMLLKDKADTETYLIENHKNFTLSVRRSS